jgi:hypothetical protein
MTRKTGVLLLVLSFLRIALSQAESVKDALDQKYKKHVLALRFPFAHGDMKFDSAGQPLYARLPRGHGWSVAAFTIENLSLSQDTLQMKGRRIASTEKKKGKPVLVPFEEPVKLEIHLDQPLKSLDDAQAVLGRVFLLDDHKHQHAMPEFRRADDSTSGGPHLSHRGWRRRTA